MAASNKPCKPAAAAPQLPASFPPGLPSLAVDPVSQAVPLGIWRQPLWMPAPRAPHRGILAQLERGRPGLPTSLRRYMNNKREQGRTRRWVLMRNRGYRSSCRGPERATRPVCQSRTRGGRRPPVLLEGRGMLVPHKGAGGHGTWRPTSGKPSGWPWSSGELFFLHCRRGRGCCCFEMFGPSESVVPPLLGLP